MYSFHLAIEILASTSYACLLQDDNTLKKTHCQVSSFAPPRAKCRLRENKKLALTANVQTQSALRGLSVSLACCHV